MYDAATPQNYKWSKAGDGGGAEVWVCDVPDPCPRVATSTLGGPGQEGPGISEPAPGPQ